MFKQLNLLARVLTLLCLMSAFVLTTAGDPPPVDRNWKPSQQYQNAISALEQQRQLTSGAVQQLWNLCQGDYNQNGRVNAYYTGAEAYYAQDIAGNFNSALESLADAAADGGNIDVAAYNNTFTTATQDNYNFNKWASQVNSYITSSPVTSDPNATASGGGSEGPASILAAIPDAVSSVIQAVASVIDTEIQTNAQQDQQMRTEVSQQLKNLEWPQYMYQILPQSTECSHIVPSNT